MGSSFVIIFFSSLIVSCLLFQFLLPRFYPFPHCRNVGKHLFHPSLSLLARWLTGRLLEMESTPGVALFACHMFLLFFTLVYSDNPNAVLASASLRKAGSQHNQRYVRPFFKTIRSFKFLFQCSSLDWIYSRGNWPNFFWPVFLCADRLLVVFFVIS